MKRDIVSVLLVALIAAPILNAIVYSIAFAKGASIDTSLAIAAADSGFSWNPTTWDWPWIVGTSVTVLGAIIAALRPIALATKWTGDNWLLAKLEWVLAMVVRLFVPLAIREKSMPISLGGGKGGVGDQPMPNPATGGKSGGDAS